MTRPNVWRPNSGVHGMPACLCVCACVHVVRLTRDYIRFIFPFRRCVNGAMCVFASLMVVCAIHSIRISQWRVCVRCVQSHQRYARKRTAGIRLTHFGVPCVCVCAMYRIVCVYVSYWLRVMVFSGSQCLLLFMYVVCITRRSCTQTRKYIGLGQHIVLRLFGFCL